VAEKVFQRLSFFLLSDLREDLDETDLTLRLFFQITRAKDQFELSLDGEHIFKKMTYLCWPECVRAIISSDYFNLLVNFNIFIVFVV
jgi:hypothetical protein